MKEDYKKDITKEIKDKKIEKEAEEKIANSVQIEESEVT